MLQIYVIGFETVTSQKWGAIVILPAIKKPHMFSKGLSCMNPSRRASMTAPRIDRAVDGFVDPQPQDKVERGILELGQVADGRRLEKDAGTT